MGVRTGRVKVVCGSCGRVLDRLRPGPVSTVPFVRDWDFGPDRAHGSVRCDFDPPPRRPGEPQFRTWIGGSQRMSYRCHPRCGAKYRILDRELAAEFREAVTFGRSIPLTRRDE